MYIYIYIYIYICVCVCVRVCVCVCVLKRTRTWNEGNLEGNFFSLIVFYLLNKKIEVSI